MPSTNLSAVEKPHAGPERRCYGSRHCAGSGPSWTKPVVCLGTPPGRLAVWCAVCEKFVCGTCAIRMPVTIDLGLDAATGWHLACASCAQPLGQPLENAVLVCAERDVLELLADAGDGLVRCPPEAVEVIRSVAWFHEAQARKWLAGCFWALTFPAMLAQVDAAIAEAPGESVAWFFKGWLCRIGEMNRVADRAVKEFHRRPITDPKKFIFPDTGRLRCKSVAEFLRPLTAPNENSTESQSTAVPTADSGFARKSLFASTMPEDIHAQLAAAQASLMDAGSIPSNARLQAFESAVAASRKKRIKMKDRLRSLFASQPRPPEEVANYLETAELLDRLQPRLSPEQWRRISLENLQMKMGRLEATVFMATLRSLAESHGLVTERFKMVEKHLSRDGISGSVAEALRRAIWEEEHSRFRELAETAEELHRCHELSRLHLMSELVRFVSLHGMNIEESFRDRHAH